MPQLNSVCLVLRDIILDLVQDNVLVAWLVNMRKKERQRVSCVQQGQYLRIERPPVHLVQRVCTLILVVLHV